MTSRTLKLAHPCSRRKEEFQELRRRFYPSCNIVPLYPFFSWSFDFTCINAQVTVACIFPCSWEYLIEKWKICNSCYLHFQFHSFLSNCFSMLPKQWDELTPPLRQGLGKASTEPGRSEQPEPTDYRPLPINLDYAQPTRPVSDGQLFNEMQLKQMTDTIAAGINTSPSPSELLSPDRLMMKTQRWWSSWCCCDSACNSIAKVLSYRCELDNYVSNNFKIKISKGQYDNLAKLADNFSDPNDETQYFSLTPRLSNVQINQGKISHREASLDRSFSDVCIYISHSTSRMCLFFN